MQARGEEGMKGRWGGGWTERDKERGRGLFVYACFLIVKQGNENAESGGTREKGTRPVPQGGELSDKEREFFHGNQLGVAKSLQTCQRVLEMRPGNSIAQAELTWIR